MNCFYCFRHAGKYCCSFCKLVGYCNADCQLNDWPRHKLLCGKEKEAVNQYSIKKPTIDEFEQQMTLGDGNFSVIREVTNKSQVTYALKIINLTKVSHNNREADILMEKYALNKLSDDPYVVKMFGTFKMGNFAYILMEYIRGKELWEQCRSFGLCSSKLCQYYFYLLVEAVKEIHKKGIIHRDIKVLD